MIHVSAVLLIPTAIITQLVYAEPVAHENKANRRNLVFIPGAGGNVGGGAAGGTYQPVQGGDPNLLNAMLNSANPQLTGGGFVQPGSLANTPPIQTGLGGTLQTTMNGNPGLLGPLLGVSGNANTAIGGGATGLIQNPAINPPGLTGGMVVPNNAANNLAAMANTNFGAGGNTFANLQAAMLANRGNVVQPNSVYNAANTAYNYNNAGMFQPTVLTGGTAGGVMPGSNLNLPGASGTAAMGGLGMMGLGALGMNGMNAANMGQCVTGTQPYIDPQSNLPLVCNTNIQCPGPYLCLESTVPNSNLCCAAMTVGFTCNVGETLLNFPGTRIPQQCGRENYVGARNQNTIFYSCPAGSVCFPETIHNNRRGICCYPGMRAPDATVANAQQFRGQLMQATIQAACPGGQQPFVIPRTSAAASCYLGYWINGCPAGYYCHRLTMGNNICCPNMQQ